MVVAVKFRYQHIISSLIGYYLLHEDLCRVEASLMCFTGCVLRRHLYVDLQLYVSKIYCTARMNTDR